MKPLKIGKLSVKNRLFLAPMVDVTDLAYRLVCREQGAGMAYTEMLYIDAILHKNSKTESLMKTCKEDKPVGIQVTGNSVKEFERFVESGKWKNFGLIDINCGCPSIRITGNQAGSFLMRNPRKISSMVKVLKETGKPVSVKIRLGFKSNNAMNVARAVERAGADALTIHGRLATQGASVKADWLELQKVKSKIGIPVIGNGDVFSGKDAAKALGIVDGVMIARGAIGNPFIFREVLRYLRTGNEKETTKNERIKGFRKYLRLCEKYDLIDMGRVKYLGGNFLKDFADAASVRNDLMKCKNIFDIKKFLGNI